MWDVVTLGETMLRLTPPNFSRLEQARTLDVEVGGTESNTAVGLARLGLRVLWVSRLTDNPLGKHIAREIASHGVDTSRVVWTEEDRIGIYFYEEGKAPRGSNVIYDRRDSAMSRMKPEELPTDLFSGAKGLLHLTGITPAIGEPARETAERAARSAKQAGWKLSFDLNFRSKLWSGESARKGCEPFLAQADVVFAPLGDIEAIYGADAARSPETAIEFLRRLAPAAVIVVTAGVRGSVGAAPGSKALVQPCFPAEELGRLGGGDAFSTGFLFSLLFVPEHGGDVGTALRWGSAAAALKYSTPGDIPLFTRAEVERLLASPDLNLKLVR